jgi:alkylhydroperoxidase family enzyme
MQDVSRRSVIFEQSRRRLFGLAYRMLGSNCIDMHWKDLKAGGETDQRLYMLDAWRESPFYSERERAAFAWAEAVTLVTEGHVPDEVFEEARKQFNESELVNLTLAVVAINGWNRLNIAFRTVPGNYRPRAAQALV